MICKNAAEKCNPFPPPCFFWSSSMPVKKRQCIILQNVRLKMILFSRLLQEKKYLLSRSLVTSKSPFSGMAGMVSGSQTGRAAFCAFVGVLVVAF